MNRANSQINRITAAAAPVIQNGRVVVSKPLVGDWSEKRDLSLRILVYHQAKPNPGAVLGYAAYMASLLNVWPDYIQVQTQEKPGFDDLIKQARQSVDLVIYSEPNQSFLQKLFFDSPGCRAAEQLPVSVLVVRQPRWPLKKILLVTRGQRLDHAAVDWLVRLKRPVQVVVAVLALQPYLSGIDSRALYAQGLETWLASETPLGHQLRRIARWLTNEEIEERLQLQFRPGSPQQQIQRAVDETRPDLIIIAADAADWWTRRLLGELIGPLLAWADRPVLIAKSELDRGKGQPCRSF